MPESMTGFDASKVVLYQGTYEDIKQYCLASADPFSCTSDPTDVAAITSALLLADIEGDSFAGFVGLPLFAVDDAGTTWAVRQPEDGEIGGARLELRAAVKAASWEPVP